MPCLICKTTAVLVVGLAIAVGSRAGDQQAEPQSAAAIRKALNETITLDYNAQSINDAIDHLHQKTKLNIVVDQVVFLPPLALQMAGMGGFGLPGGFPGQGFAIPGPFALKSERGKVNAVVQSMVDQLLKNANKSSLTYVVLRDCVLITTETVGYQRQMQQRVNVDVRETPLADVLQSLADETGAHLLIDPQMAVLASRHVSLKLENVTLETAVRLLTDLRELGPARVGNVLYVTAEVKAEKLRKENIASAAVADPTGGIGIWAGPGGVLGGPAFGGGIGGMPPPPLGAPVADKKKMDEKKVDDKEKK